MSYYFTQEDYLTHHGILGQKWGVRNGPPYPLKDEDYSKAEKEAEKKFHLTDKQKKYLKIGLAVAATAITLNILYKSGAISEGKIIVDNFIKNAGNINLSKLSDDQKQALINPNVGLSLADSNNCGNCVLADEAIERGIPVKARGNTTGMTIGDLISHYQNMPSQNVLTPSVNDLHSIRDFNSIKSLDDWRDRGKEVKEVLSNQIKSNFPEGSRGCYFIPNVNGSHWMSWKIKDGNVVFKNPQYPGLVKSETKLNRYLGSYKYHPNASNAALTIIRTDNVKFGDRLYDAVISLDAKRNTSYYDTWRVAGENFVINYFR